jgi:hypothetical protein
MTHGRNVMLGSALVVGLGSSAALSALFLAGAKPGVGPLPAEALSLPSETRFLVGVDVKRLVASPLYRRYAASSPAVFSEIKSRTGLDPERDIDRIVVTNTSEKANSGVVLVWGSIHAAAISRSVETPDHKDVQRKNLGGETLFTYEDANGTSVALALLNDHSLLVGGGEAVQKVLANASSGVSPLRSNLPLMALLGRVRLGATLWMVGDQSLLAALPRTLPGAGGGNAPSFNLPPLRSLMATADLDPAVVFEVEGEAADPAAAKNLADIIRGIMALATMQAQQKPELQSLASAVSVTNDQSRVLLNARLPYELLDSLQGRTAPRPPAPKPPASSRP